MITYDVLWETLKEKGLKKQNLVDDFGLSKGMMDNLKHNRPITTTTINDLCNFLNVTPDKILTYKKD